MVVTVIISVVILMVMTHDRSGCDRGGSWGGNRCCGAFDGDRGGGSGGDCGGGRLGGRDGCS